MLFLTLLLSIIFISTPIEALEPPETPEPAILAVDSIKPVDDLNLPFGKLITGLSITRAVIITNNGNAELLIGNISSIDPPFFIDEDDCSWKTIGPIETEDHCTVKIRFYPTTADSFNNTLEVPSNSSDNAPLTITISGTAFSSASNSPPSLPELLFPGNDQQALNTSIEFKWQRSSDTDSDPVSYYLYYSENEFFINSTTIQIAFLNNESHYYKWAYSNVLFFGIVFAGTVRRKYIPYLLIVMLSIPLISCGSGGGGGSTSNSEPATPVSVTEVSQTVSGLKTGTTYYWKILADDAKGGIMESEVRRFTTL